MATKTQAVTNMNPTSDMTLDDIIRDLEARRDAALRTLLSRVAAHMKTRDSLVAYQRYGDESTGISKSLVIHIKNPTGDLCSGSLVKEWDEAQTALKAALSVLASIEGEA